MIRFSFSDDMRSRILNGQWLSGEEMSGAMSLIKRQFPKIGGLENTLVLKHAQIVTKAQQCDNIYIVHEADAHWVCAKYTCRRNVFMIFDSMQGTIVNRNTRGQLEKVGYCGAEFSMQSMQRQSGSVDCGLFAIAVAVYLANGIDPSRATYKQALMRRHLNKCFEQRVMTAFPRFD
jgi:hypothetical protein